MNEVTLDLVIGQSSADAALLNVLMCTLIGRDPTLAAALEQLVEVAAPDASSQLQGVQLESFRTRMQEHRNVLHALRADAQQK